MTRTLNFRIALAVFALVAVPAVAPPPQLSTQQLFSMYERSHEQKLTVDDTASIEQITPTKYSATAGIQTYVNVGTNYSWARLVLLDGGWPITTSNVSTIVQWMRQENGVNNWWNRDNPLNNSYGAPGAGGTGRNANLIMAAHNAAGALHANAGGGYAGIVAALAAGDGDVRDAIFASSWSSSHYANGTHWSTAPVPEVKAPASAW